MRSQCVLYSTIAIPIQYYIPCRFLYVYIQLLAKEKYRKNNCCWAIWQTPSWGIVMKTTTVEFISATHFSFGQKWMLHFHLSTFFFFFFPSSPSSLAILSLSLHEILIFDQWKSIHILLSELRNSVGRKEDSNSTLRPGFRWSTLP